jgi:hypothetical protein
MVSNRAADYSAAILTVSDGVGVELANLGMLIDLFDEISVKQGLRHSWEEQASEMIVASISAILSATRSRADLAIAAKPSRSPFQARQMSTRLAACFDGQAIARARAVRKPCEHTWQPLVFDDRLMGDGDRKDVEYLDP